MANHLALPEPEKVSLTQVCALVIPQAQRAREQIAIREDVAAARELCRQLEAYRKYLQDREGRDLLAAECRRTEVLIGKLLGPAEQTWTGKPTTSPKGEVVQVPREDRHKFRVLAAHEAKVECLLGQGIVARNAILGVIQRPQKNGEFRNAPRLVKSLEELEGEQFATIYADPPWSYGNRATRAAARNHYPTMTIDAIAELPIGKLATQRAHLWLWTTNGFLFECPRIFKAWGFEFKSSYVWVKPVMGIGNYLRNAHEFLLLAVRGGLVAESKDVISWGEFDRQEHSDKPEAIRREVVERISPGPRLELFGRAPVDGWTVWGNQIELDLYDHDVIGGS